MNICIHLNEYIYIVIYKYEIRCIYIYLHTYMNKYI